MAPKPSQPNDVPPSDAGSAESTREEQELLDVLAGQAVERLLSDQAATLSGGAVGLDDAVETPAPAPDPHAKPSEIAPPAEQEGLAGRTYVTPDEMESMFGPADDSPQADAADTPATPTAPTDSQAVSAQDRDVPSEPVRTDPGAEDPGDEPASTTETAGFGENGPVSQNEMDALFEQVAAEAADAADAEDAADPAPAAEEPEPFENGPVSQADLDALFRQAADGTSTRSAPAEAPRGAPPTDSGLVSEADPEELVGQAQPKANTPAPYESFSAAAPQLDEEGQAATQADLDDATQQVAAAAQQPPSDAGGAGEGPMSQDELDDMLSRAALDADDEPGDEGQDVEAALDHQQAQHPDAGTGGDDGAADEGVSQDELQALQRESSDTDGASAPVMSIAELDSLLAERAAQGAAAADAASDNVAGEPSTEPETDVGAPDVVADVATPSAGQVDDMGAAPIDSVEAPEESDADSPLSQADVRSGPTVGGPAGEAGAPAFAPGVAGQMVRLVERINEPFADMKPLVRDLLGYAAVALIGGSVWLLLMALWR